MGGVAAVIPDLVSVLFVISIVLVCVFVLNALIFKPVLRVTEARLGAVREATMMAATAATRAASASAEYDTTLTAARTEVYRQMDDTRRAALDRRAALLHETKRQVETEIADATVRVTSEAAEARARIDREAGVLAGAIVDRVLGRPA
jgi:F-type H+-transporting ATPase subunit b